MRKILGAIVLVMAFGLSSCFISGTGRINLYVDDELYSSYKVSVSEELSLDFPQKEDMMFTGWEYKDRVVFDSIEVTGDMDLYAQWEDPTEVFTYADDPRGTGIIRITEYTGDAQYMKIPIMIDGNFVVELAFQSFKDSTVEVMFLPMDVGVFYPAFEGSQLKRLEYYGRYEVPFEKTIGMADYNDLIDEYGDVCTIVSGSIDFGVWELAEGCPVQKVYEKTSVVVIDGIEYFSYKTLVDKNTYTDGWVNQLYLDAFEGASNLEILRLPNGMGLFYTESFIDCPNLENILVSEHNLDLSSKDGVLYNKEGNQLLIYPPGKEEKEFTLPENVTSVSMSAFLYTSELETLNIPKEYTGNLLLFGAHSLKEIIVEQGNEEYYSVDGVLFSGNDLIKYPASKEGVSYSLPEGIVRISGNAFAGNKYLEELILPRLLTEILSSAFIDTESLTVLDIPSSVEVIRGLILINSSITTLILRRDATIDGNITSIIDFTFQSNGLERTIYVPDASYAEYLESLMERYYGPIDKISELE